MSGKKDRYGERERSWGPTTSPCHDRRLSQREMREFRRGIDVANSIAKREGRIPKKPVIIKFSCRCNCFHIKVD